jgi:hypothetical protein
MHSSWLACLRVHLFRYAGARSESNIVALGSLIRMSYLTKLKKKKKNDQARKDGRTAVDGHKSQSTLLFLNIGQRRKIDYMSDICLFAIVTDCLLCQSDPLFADSRPQGNSDPCASLSPPSWHGF